MIRPFVKWVGGKGQLLNTFKDMFPSKLKDNKVKTYIEPFVGGGAVLFYILQNYKVKDVVINDINKDLINCYICIKNNVEKLINNLENLEKEYVKSDDKKEYFYKIRKRYNDTSLRAKCDYKRASEFIFLNKTCFNGLYRVNKEGRFNVSYDRYKKVVICDKDNLRLCSKLLKNVEIYCGDYFKVLKKTNKKTFIYFDPPYRLLTKDSSFDRYDRLGFNDDDQIRVANVFKILDRRRALLMLSNSDPKNIDSNDDFFDKLYAGFNIKRVFAKRMINCKATKRGSITEIVIRNYENKDVA